MKSSKHALCCMKKWCGIFFTICLNNDRLRKDIRLRIFLDFHTKTTESLLRYSLVFKKCQWMLNKRIFRILKIKAMVQIIKTIIEKWSRRTNVFEKMADKHFSANKWQLWRMNWVLAAEFEQRQQDGGLTISRGLHVRSCKTGSWFVLQRNMGNHSCDVPMRRGLKAWWPPCRHIWRLIQGAMLLPQWYLTDGMQQRWNLPWLGLHPTLAPSWAALLPSEITYQPTSRDCLIAEYGCAKYGFNALNYAWPMSVINLIGSAYAADRFVR